MTTREYTNPEYHQGRDYDRWIKSLDELAEYKAVHIAFDRPDTMGETLDLVWSLPQFSRFVRMVHAHVSSLPLKFPADEWLPTFYVMGITPQVHARSDSQIALNIIRFSADLDNYMERLNHGDDDVISRYSAAGSLMGRTCADTSEEINEGLKAIPICIAYADIDPDTNDMNVVIVHMSTSASVTYIFPVHYEYIDEHETISLGVLGVPELWEEDSEPPSPLTEHEKTAVALLHSGCDAETGKSYISQVGGNESPISDLMSRLKSVLREAQYDDDDDDDNDSDGDLSFGFTFN